LTENEVQREVARLLLDVGAVAIDLEHPFRYTSGILSPIYCDNRMLISFPIERRRIVAWLAERLEATLGRTGVDVIAGTATAGIPYAAWLAERLDLPMVYVRAAAKEHGRGQRVEGRLKAGQRVVVVEDLVTTGGSSISTVEGVEEAGGKVVGCLAIFSYELPRSAEAFEARGIPLLPLTGLSTLLEVAAESGRVSPERLDEVREGIRRAFA
jgi:orotate phosphoribosyltransferase